MNTEREIILRYTTKEERQRVRYQIKVYGIAAGLLFGIFAISQYIAWLFYEFQWLDGIWDVTDPGESTPAFLALIGIITFMILVCKWFTWTEPDRDERSIMKERYGVEYDTGEVDCPIEDDE